MKRKGFTSFVRKMEGKENEEKTGIPSSEGPWCWINKGDGSLYREDILRSIRDIFHREQDNGSTKRQVHEYLARIGAILVPVGEVGMHQRNGCLVGEPSEYIERYLGSERQEVLSYDATSVWIRARAGVNRHAEHYYHRAYGVEAEGPRPREEPVRSRRYGWTATGAIRTYVR